MTSNMEKSKTEKEVTSNDLIESKYKKKVNHKRRKGHNKKRNFHIRHHVNSYFILIYIEQGASKEKFN